MLREWLRASRPDVILNTTAFSARGPDGCVLDDADAPVLQAMLSGATREAWLASPRGLGAADLAMNVVLPELDGRIGGGAISFKAEAARRHHLEFASVTHAPDPAGVAHAADLALGWAALRRTPRERIGDWPASCRTIPAKRGAAAMRSGWTRRASVAAIGDILRRRGVRCRSAAAGPAT